VDLEQVKTGAEIASTGATIYRVLAERAARQRTGTEAAVRHRVEIQSELRELLGPAAADNSQELIVLDAARAREYPEPDEKFRLRSISPWFKSEGWCFYPGGLEVGDTQYRRIKLKGGCAEIVEKGGQYMLLGLRIPFENIIKPQSYDDAYGLPILYCHFTCKRHLPYETVEVYQERPGRYRHLDGVQFKNRATLREAAALPELVKMHLAQRRFDRDVEQRQRQLESGG
jgi:hypothetical protein